MKELLWFDLLAVDVVPTLVKAFSSVFSVLQSSPVQPYLHQHFLLPAVSPRQNPLPLQSLGHLCLEVSRDSQVKVIEVALGHLTVYPPHDLSLFASPAEHEHVPPLLNLYVSVPPEQVVVVQAGVYELLLLTVAHLEPAPIVSTS